MSRSTITAAATIAASTPGGRVPVPAASTACDTGSGEVGSGGEVSGELRNDTTLSLPAGRGDGAPPGHPGPTVVPMPAMLRKPKHPEHGMTWPGTGRPRPVVTGAE